MAAIFQLRRGTTAQKPTLTAGELYVNTTSQSLQLGIDGTTEVTLVKLNDQNIGSLNLTGDIRLSGSIFLGNESADNISALGVFNTNLVPTGQRDVGTTSAPWANVYASNISASSFTGSFSGSIGGIDITSLSSSIDNRLDNIEEFTSSVTGSINKVAYFTQENRISSFGGSFIGSGTFGLGTSATSSVSERLMVDSSTFNIATFQTSQQESYAQVNIKNFGSGSASSADLIIWNDVATENTSYIDLGINSSNYSAGFIGYGGDGYLYTANRDLYIGTAETGSHGHVHIYGGFQWDSSSLSIYSDGTIGINTDKLNNSASTIPTAGYAMEISGGVLFDNDVDFLGNISASTISGIGNITTYSASVDSTLHRLQESTQSLNEYTQSLKSAIDVVGGDTRILGNLIVDGTQTSLNTTNVYIEDFKITLASGSLNSAAADGGGFEIAGANVSMSWEHSNTRFGINTNLGIKGEISSSTISGLGNATQFASAIQSSTASLNTFSASVLGHISDINIKTGSFENKFVIIGDVTASYNQHTASLNTYTQSVNGHISDLNSWTSSQNQKDLTISGITASYNFFTGSATASIVSLFGTASNHEIRIDDLEAKSITLESYTSSVEDRFTTLSSVTASLNIVTASLNLFTSSTYSTFSTSVDSRLDMLEYTTSILTPEGQAESFAGLNTFTASANNRLNNLESTSASLLIFSSSTDGRLDNLEFNTGSYATTGSNTFIGDQFVTGSLYITQDLIVFGSSSFQEVSASSVNIGLNRVYLNTDLPAIRYAGMSVYDSGSSGVSASILWDSQEDNFVFVHQASGSVIVDSSLLMFGPLSTGGLGSETGLIGNYILKSEFAGDGHGHHITSSQIYAEDSLLSIGTNTIVTGSVTATAFTGSIASTNGVISGSSQVELSSTNGFTTFSSSLDSRFDSVETYTSSNDTLNTLQTTRIDQLSAGTASVNTFSASVLGHISDINSYTSSLKTAFSVSGTDLIVAGNLTVLGDTVTLNVGNLSIEDKTIVIASGSTSSILSDGAGLYISGADASILWNHLNTRLDINKSIDIVGDITLSGTIDGVDISGHVSDINTKTGSFENKFATISLYTASVDSHISNTNSFTSSINTTIKTKLDVEGVISGSSQINGWGGLNNDSILKFDGGFSSLVNSSITDGDWVNINNAGGVNIETGGLRVTGSIVGSIASTNGVVSGSSQVLNILSSLNTYTGSNDTLNTLQTTRIDQLSASTASVNSFTSSINTTIKNKLDVEGVVSGSSQITLSSTTGGGTTSNVQFGSLGIGTAASGVSGEIRATGDITAFYSSDERLKENIQPIQNALEKVEMISGNTYNWKEGFETIHSHIGNDLGVIAQEVQSVLPEVVTERETGYLAVDYVKLVPVLIQAIKELSAKVNELEKK